MLKRLLLGGTTAFLAALAASCSTSEGGSSPRQAKEPPSILCHYMAWFQNRTVDGEAKYAHWAGSAPGHAHDPSKSVYGGLRDAASVYHPRIGLYDSADTDVVDYHILSAKTAGIEGFVVDWYANEGVDENFKTLLERATELDFKVAICFEEKTCFPECFKARGREEAVSKAIADLSIAAGYAKSQAYWRKDGRPCVFVFAGWGEWPGNGRKQFSAEEWKRICEAFPEIRFVRQNFDEANPFLRAAFAWCGDKAYSKWFYKTGDALLAKGAIDFYVGSACPGFDDRGVWGWGAGPRYEARLGLENFARYWDDFESSKASALQIVTWNDFEEGTVVEPTVEDGFSLLEYAGARIAKLKRTPPPSASALAMPYEWFVLKKFADKGQYPALAEARRLLAQGSCANASEAMAAVKASSGVEIPQYIDLKRENAPLSVTTPEGRALEELLPLLRSKDNLARFAKASASSSESAAKAPGFAVDGELGTRWGSSHSDGQWLLLEFPEQVNAKGVAIAWEAAFAERYDVEVTADGLEWEKVASVSDGAPGPRRLPLPDKPFSAIRVNCVARGTGWGFSIKEIGVLKTGVLPQDGVFRAPLPSAAWSKSDSLKWKEARGVQLDGAAFGSLDLAKRFPLKSDATLRFRVAKLLGPPFANYTLQVCLFAKDGSYLGCLEPFKRAKAAGAQTLKFKDLMRNIDPKTESISFKLWLEGESGTSMELPEFEFEY